MLQQGRTRYRAFGLLGSLAVALLTGCAAPIYIQSPSLKAATATAASSFPSEADALKPFDDQLANLTAFAGQEDLAVARYWVGVRDAHFVRLLAMNPVNTRPVYLGSQVKDRLNVLIGPSTIPDTFDPAATAASIVAFESLAASQRRQYLTAEDADRKLDLGCAAIIARITDSQSDALITSVRTVDNTQGQLAKLCRRIAAKNAEINQFTAAGGAIAEARATVAEAEAKLTSDLSDRAKELQRQIAEAKTFADTDASVAQLEKFTTDLKGLLDDAVPGAKALGWTKVADALDDELKAQVCSSDKVDDAAKADAKCGDVTPTSATGRIQAVWGLAKALAQVSDATGPKRRSVPWLLAAKAIVAAEQADANLALAERKAIAVAAKKRLDALGREVTYLQRARDSKCPGASAPANPSCQFAAYVDAWNEGRIPAQVLEYRPIQISRSFAVQRARVIAQKQHVLASAGTATLRDYGAGGLTAAIIAQALFDAAILGVGIGDL